VDFGLHDRTLDAIDDIENYRMSENVRKHGGHKHNMHVSQANKVEMKM